MAPWRVQSTCDDSMRYAAIFAFPFLFCVSHLSCLVLSAGKYCVCLCDGRRFAILFIFANRQGYLIINTMEVDVSECQAARFAVMQYAAMLKRVPEASLVERFNNADAIVVDGVGRIPFPNAEHFVQKNQLTFGYTPSTGSPTSQPPVFASPKLTKSSKDSGAQLPSVVPVEAKLTISGMELLLRSIGASTVDCVTTNDYAVRLNQVLDRQFDLTAEISGAVVKVRRPFGTSFPPAAEQAARDKIKGKLGAVDGSATSLTDAQRRITKLQDRVRDMQETIDRLRQVKSDIAVIQANARSIRETVVQVKQASRFQFLDMQDFLMDQVNRFKAMVGSDALRQTGVSAAGSMNAAKKAAMEEQIRTMKEQNPLRDSASVLKVILEETVREVQKVLRAPMDPNMPVELDSDDDDDARSGGKKKDKGAKEKPPKLRRQANCGQQLVKLELRLPKGELSSPGWTLLKTYDRAGPEMDLLKASITSLKQLQQMQKLMGQWFVENSSTQNLLNGLRREVETLKEQLAQAQSELEANAAAAAQGAKGGKTKASSEVSKTKEKVEVAPKGGAKSGRRDSEVASPAKTPGPKGSGAADKKKSNGQSKKMEDRAPVDTQAVRDPPVALATPPSQSPASGVTPRAVVADPGGQSETTEGLPDMDDRSNDVRLEGSSAPPGAGLESTLPRPSTVDSCISDDVQSLSNMKPYAPLPPLMSTLDSIAESINASTTKSNRGEDKRGNQSKSSDGSRAAVPTQKPPRPAAATQLDLVSSSTPRAAPATTPPLTSRSVGATTPQQVTPPLSARQQALGRDQQSIVRSIFYELAAVGVPARLLPLLEDLFAVMLPGEACATLRRACVADEQAEAVAVRASQQLGDPHFSTSRVEPCEANTVEHQVIADEQPKEPPASVGAPVPASSAPGAGSSKRRTSKFKAIGLEDAPPPASQVEVSSSNVIPPGTSSSQSPLLASKATPQPAATAGEVQPSLLQRQQSSSSLPAARRSVSALEGAVTPPAAGLKASFTAAPSTPPPTRLPTNGEARADDPAEEEERQRESLMAMNAYLQKAKEPPPAAVNPLTQIRQLRQQYLQSNASAASKVSAADAVDPLELPEEDAAFALKKKKFVEMTRKLLSDLPVLKRERRQHPLFDDVKESPPPLLFAPAVEFPISRR